MILQNHMKNFQIIVIVIFITSAVVGVLVFSGAIPIGKNESQGGGGNVVIWGTASGGAITPILQVFNEVNPNYVVSYVEKSPTTFDRDLLEALAVGQGPDIFLVPDNLLFRYSNKIFTIPYQNYPASTFKNTYASASEIFMSSRGISAFPLSIDPLVMYYNRSMLDANDIIYPPKYWDEFASLVPIFTKKDESNKIITSAVALGQFSNIDHAKDIIAALFMQAGNPMVYEKEGNYVSALSTYNQKYSLRKVLEFYTDFANSLRNVYSWNKSLPISGEFFSANNLAFYFGFASELKSFINKNPNQNFQVAQFPQIKDSTFKLTGARVTGLAISSSSRNFNGAYAVASLMANGDFALQYASALGIAPARRDLLSFKPIDSFFPTFYSSALISRAWLDPSSPDTDIVFRLMVEKVISGDLTPDGAVIDASTRLQLLLRR